MIKNIYLKIAVLSLAIGLLPPVAAAQRKSATKTLCQADEQTIWSCALATNNKLASVCGSKDLAADKGYVQYRFGLPGNVELEFPQNREDSQKAFKYSRYTRPLVTMLTLSFINNGVTYEIHADDNAEEKPPVRASYLEIETGGKLTTLQCKLPDTGTLMDLEDFVPRDEEN